MAKAAIIFMVIAAVTRSRGEAISNYNSNHGRTSSFGDILKPPPPPPPLGNIQPVPFHGGGPRTQRQNIDIGYQYPPPPPPPPLQPSANFKFPAPFYRQYNFNFVPPPQPFVTTPSPTMFQKVSSWLFPSGQNTHEGLSPINAGPSKKDCNPCNLVPWIPVIRYDLSGKKLQPSSYPTYGPPSATALTNAAQSGYQYPVPQKQLNYPVSGGVPHANYGPPVSYLSTPSSTYGPPSPTHTLPVLNGPPTSTHISSSTYGISSSSYGISSTSYGSPSSSYGSPSSSYGSPGSSYGSPSSTYGSPSSLYGTPSSPYGSPSSSNGSPSSTYGSASSTYHPLSSTYGSPSPPLETFGSDTNFKPVTPGYSSSVPNYESPQTNSLEAIRDGQPSEGLTLPKISNPTGFKNSYGEPITSFALNNIPYPISATAAESSKIKTEVLPGPDKQADFNNTFAVAKPAPFAIYKGRNIHTLLPVSLPNLSQSPLPPIFNARPFRTNTKIYLNNLHSINSLQQHTNNEDVHQKVHLSDFSHSVEYPPTVIQSPILDFKNFNQSKGYRNIPHYPEDLSHDVSSQASEDHIAATNNNQENQESSFESTGLEFDNELYDNNVPLDFRKNNKLPLNHRPNFSDLRGVTDEIVDKYRTDNNLQAIDSPMLYLKPSIPHKSFENFVLSLSTPSNTHDYEIYDEIATTASPEHSTISESWNNNKSPDYEQGLLSPPPVQQENRNKPKVVQFIIPYTTSNNDISNSGETDWISASADESQGRKVPAQTISYSDYNTVTQNYDNTDFPDQTTVTEQTELYQHNTHAILNDLYDVKEPPFDIIKLQHNIDDWTEQEYSNQHYKGPQKVRPSGKYPHAKQIPDEYFTTPSPTIYVTTEGNYNYKYNSYDYEGSSSIQHSVQEEPVQSSSNGTSPIRYYNSINRHKEKSNDVKKLTIDDILRPHIYTAASSFRSTSTTPAPWEKIQTSISPLTKEKIYVVTSKPWPDRPNITTWYSGVPFESKKTTALDNDVSASDNLPFKSPRFLHRPSIPSASGTETMKADSSFGFSKTWHRSINELESGIGASRNSSVASDRSDGAIFNDHSINDEDMIEPTTDKSYEDTTTESMSTITSL